LTGDLGGALRLSLTAGGDLVALVRAAPAAATSLVVAIEPGSDAVALALARAALGPLAIERAPATRVNAVLAAPDANPADVEAATAWLERAVSTTGQLIEVNAVPASARTGPATR
jgi:glucose-6-phosphate isomerase